MLQSSPMKTMILMHSKVSAGSDVAYINVQSWHFLDGTEWSYSKPESYFWIEIQDRLKWFMWTDFVLKGRELPWSSWGRKYHAHWGDLILRVLDCIVTILLGVYLVLCLFCFVKCGCVYCVGFVMCRCFGNMCTYICCVLYCLYCVFVWFRLRIFILICY